jgi:hypothetical protein
MRKAILFSLTTLTLAVAIRASTVVLFNPASSPITNQVVRILPSEDTLRWLGRTDVLFNPSVPPSTNGLWKVTNGLVLNFTQVDLDRVAATNAINTANAIAAFEAFERTNAAAVFGTSKNEQSRNLRMALELVLSEINILRTNAGLGIRTTNQLNAAISNALLNATN